MTSQPDRGPRDWPETWPERPVTPSDRLCAITAKTDQTGQTTSTMSLIQHGRDSAAVAGWLVDHWLASSVVARLAAHFGSEGTAQTFVQWSAAVHDVGKSSPAFQSNLARNGDLYGVRSRLERAGFEFPPGEGPGRHVPHCRIGQGVVDRWIEERFPDDALWRATAASIVGAHHGVPPGLYEVQALNSDPWTAVFERQAQDRAWMDAQNEFLDLMTADLDATEAVLTALRSPLTPALQVTVAGLVVMADWLASDASRFPYAEDPDMAERLEEAALDYDILPPWRAVVPPESENLLVTRFGFDDGTRANAGQRALLEAARSMTEPGLLVFEAPTGSGKTEAALMAAEVLAGKFGCGGLEFLLPTRGTTDGVFERLQPWVERLPEQGRQSISLAHGKAGLNDSFVELTRQSRYVGIGDDGAETALVGDDCEAATEAWVSSWFSGRRKATLASMVAGTIDQLLLSALQTRHVALRHLGLAGKVVVIDEAHAVDEYMLVYLERALMWLGAHDVPTIAMSATLPDTVRSRLITAYTGQAIEGEWSPEPVRVTSADARGVTSSAVPWESHDRAVTPSFIGMETEDIVECAAAAVYDGACVAVIRNTVGEAQETYRKLSECVGSDNAQLLHSRFLGVDRARRERHLRSALGPGREARPSGFVIVATQVLEVSLDIDVDLMITDLAPLDVLFQRAGRLHRHRRGHDESERPAGYRSARLLIAGCEVPCAEEVPKLAGGSAAVYGMYPLLRAAAVLRTVQGARVTVSDVPRLVQQAFVEPAKDIPAGWANAVADAEAKHKVKLDDQEARARAFLLREPKMRRFKTLNDLLPQRASEAETEARAAAQVRDSQDSIEVIVVRRTAYGAQMLPVVTEAGGEGQLIPTELEPPDPSAARLLAKCTVSLPPRLTRFHFDRTLDALERAASSFSSWQVSPVLRGELVLPLNEQDEIELCGVRLRYDSDLGLVDEPVDREEYV
ncbi:CRISPR-associated helicase Cas3' [Dermacoccus abyssi]